MPVAPLAVLVLFKGEGQLIFSKIGPKGGCEIPFGISPLPDQEVAAAQLAGGADDQVRIWDTSGEQVFADQISADLIWVDTPSSIIC